MPSCSGTSRRWMFLVNHIFLPPKLPQKDDASGPFQKHLAREVLEALRAFKAAYGNDASGKEVSAIEAATSAVSSLLRVHDFSGVEGDATISAEELQEALGNLKNTDSAPPILLHVSAQNAGILAYRHEDSIVLETSELSAENHAVIGTLGRLRRRFPGIATSIPATELEPSFIHAIARTLGKMSTQVVPDAVPITSKATRLHEEIRDTASPKLVTELLTGVILPRGRAAEVSSIGKHIRDDVLWRKCVKPWRRSSMWLLIRVSVHLIFLRSGLEPQDALGLYKHFMVHFAAHILAKAGPMFEGDATCKEWCDIIYAMRAKISRRLLKLEKPLPASIQEAVRDVMADDVLQRTWGTICESRADASRVDTESLRLLTFEKDTFAGLPKLDEFIDGLSKRQRSTLKMPFAPRCPLPDIYDILDWTDKGAPENAALKIVWLDGLIPSVPESARIVARGVSDDVGDTCTTLWEAMESYEKMVRTDYSSNPEAWSLMVLGVLELWVACDAFAVAECPMLQDYDPDIDSRRL